MGDGRLVLIATAWLHRMILDGEQGEETPIILYSDDEGESWSQPREIPFHGDLTSLGGTRLMISAGTTLRFSKDGGETWSEPHTVQYGLDKPLVERQNLVAIGYREGPAHGPTGWRGYSVMTSSHDGGRTWGNPIRMPAEWSTSECAITRAHDGALVVAMRTAPEPAVVNALPAGPKVPGDPEYDHVGYNDHWRRITTARSNRQ